MRRHRNADAGGRIGNSVAAEALVCVGEALTFAADERGSRHTHVGEGELGRVVGAEDVDQASHLEPGRVGPHSEGADALASLGVAGTGVDRAPGRRIGAGVEDLGAIDHPFVAVTDGAGADRAAGVGAATRLRQADEALPRVFVLGVFSFATSSPPRRKRP